MKEKLRFRQISRRIPEEEAVTPSDRAIEPSQQFMKKDTIEYSVYDVLLEPVKYETLSLSSQRIYTEVKQIEPKQTPVSLYDPSLGRMMIQRDEVAATNVERRVMVRETPLIVNVDLNRRQISAHTQHLDTQIPKKAEMEVARKINVESTDIHLEKIVLEGVRTLNTEVLTNELELGMGALGRTEQHIPIFEELIGSNERLPRSFAESLNAPFVLLIGEDEYEWHIPIIYALKELFREITDRYPRVTFREPELLEEVEERVDSTEPHSLEQFAFEHRIEFLDARKTLLAVDEFTKIVKGRLESAFLQQFGILVVAVRRGNLEKARKALRTRGIRTYVCSPNDEYYERFCSKVLGVSPLSGFFDGLESYRNYLNQTVKGFSVFVKRGEGTTDKFQYPLKVATFVYLLNDIRKRRKVVIESYEELYEFVRDVVINESMIKVEEKINSNGKEIIPDLIYYPEGEEIYIEIETLIGTLEPMKKIDETIEKYENKGGKIWVVLRPISALLHYEELKAREKAYKVLYENREIKFKVLTLKSLKGKFEWQLVSLDSFLEGIDYDGIQREG